MIINLELKLNGELPVTREELFELVNSWGRSNGFITFDNIDINKSKQCQCYDLSHLDISRIENLSHIFCNSLYNGNLSNWDISNCKYMIKTFAYSKFNNNSICNWNTSNVLNMNYMFQESIFNQSLNDWNISKVKFIDYMFYNAKFDNNISSWSFDFIQKANSVFNGNNNFANKYNNENMIPNDFIKWFEDNRGKMKEIYLSKDQILDFFDFENNKSIEL